MTSSRLINDRLSSCVGKETYDGWDSADRARRRCEKKGKPAKVFRCDHCHKWHLATAFKKPGRPVDEDDLGWRKGDIIPSLGIRVS